MASNVNSEFKDGDTNGERSSASTSNMLKLKEQLSSSEQRVKYLEAILQDKTETKERLKYQLLSSEERVKELEAMLLEKNEEKVKDEGNIERTTTFSRTHVKDLEAMLLDKNETKDILKELLSSSEHRDKDVQDKTEYDDSSIKLKQKATVTRKKKQPSTHLSHTPSHLKVQAAEPTRSANTKKHACISQPFVLPSDKKQHDSSSTCVTVTSSVDAGTIAYRSDKEVSTTFIQPKSTDVKKTTNSVDVGTVACSSDNGLGVSTTVTQQTLKSTDVQKTTKSKRSRKVKFLGRRIIHKWTEPDGSVRWYNGTVLSVRRGVDGNKDTVHQVFYEEDRESYDIDSLFDDYSDGSVKFSDI